MKRRRVILDSPADEKGNRLVRASGGHLLHILPASSAGRALCGHTPTSTRLNGGMKPRARWFWGIGDINAATCMKCRAAYKEMTK